MNIRNFTDYNNNIYGIKDISSDKQLIFLTKVKFLDDLYNRILKLLDKNFNISIKYIMVIGIIGRGFNFFG
jgi:hypothetical protein